MTDVFVGARHGVLGIWLYAFHIVSRRRVDFGGVVVVGAGDDPADHRTSVPGWTSMRRECREPSVPARGGFTTQAHFLIGCGIEHYPLGRYA